jgi:hypothetical protein
VVRTTRANNFDARMGAHARVDARAVTDEDDATIARDGSDSRRKPSRW